MSDPDDPDADICIRSSYDPLQRFDKKELVQRIRSVELDTERQKRSALAYDQQALLAKMIR